MATAKPWNHFSYFASLRSQLFILNKVKERKKEIKNERRRRALCLVFSTLFVVFIRMPFHCFCVVMEQVHIISFPLHLHTTIYRHTHRRPINLLTPRKLLFILFILIYSIAGATTYWIALSYISCFSCASHRLVWTFRFRDTQKNVSNKFVIINILVLNRRFFFHTKWF